jgi:hypothetical protein
MADITTGDLALMKDGNSWGSNGGLIFILAIFFLMFSGGWGGNRVMVGPAPATQDQMNYGFQSQQLQQIALSSANNNYETARLISEQTNSMQQQNNTNLINAIQGFNQVNLNLQNQTNVLAAQVQALDAKLGSCCCEIKTQMLQNRYEDERAANVALRNDISNYQQSQYLLGQTGRWVAWLGSGSQTAPTGT